MPSRYKASEILRTIFLSYVSLIPWIYQSEVFPPWSMPLAVISGIAFSGVSHKFRLRTYPALIFTLAATGALLAGFRLTAFFFRDSVISELYARFAMVSIPLAFILVAVFLASRLRDKSTAWKLSEPFAILGAIALSFWSQGQHRLTAFDHPLKAAAFTLTAVFLAIGSVILAIPKEKRHLAALIPLFPLLVLASFASVHSFNAAAVSANGGLIQPTLFRFDFSSVLSLQSDISLNNRLVLIVRAPDEYRSTLIRRMYLSAWDPKKGFYAAPVPGTAPQTLTVPEDTQTLIDPDYSQRVAVRQEYFIVNFDPKSLLAMDYPVKIEPYRLWPTESFNGAYAVTSMVTGFMPFELYESPPPSADSQISGELTGETLRYYTEIDAETRAYIEPIASSLTEGINGYFDRIFAMNSWLKGDSFRYSLHPGEASDGNQLRHFIANSKKGYCTYYAFSLALMCRSIGIPARVAAGFFIAPDSGSLDYYPVRSNMAHAWVEVFFPEYGWIAFDPTNQIPAEGENFQFETDPRGDDFMVLLDEIIDKKGRILASDGQIPPFDSGKHGLISKIRTLLNSLIRRYYGLLFLIPLSLAARQLLQLLTFRYSKRPRIVILLAERYARSLATRRKDERHKALREELGSLANKARFSAICTEADSQRAREILATLSGKRPSVNVPMSAIILALGLLQGTRAEAQSMPTSEEQSLYSNAPSIVQSGAASLLDRAKRAASAENWDLATTLLLEGKKEYPKDGSFPHELGGIFLDQSLYPAAIRELELALNLGYTESGIYLQLSDATGYENQDEASLLWIRRYLGLVPDNLTAWSTFGWLCYKTHRLDEGISTLKHVLETWGPDGNVSVGLGNLYSAAYNYEEARFHYSNAIRLAEERNQLYLASVYLYNRSILEETFYRFDNAYQDTERSLANAPRSSGYLMQAELEMRKLSYKEALQRYMKAQSLDSTPLATIGLAETYLEAGIPEMALLNIQAVKANVDKSWIANYGTTTQQYESDMYRLERDYWHFMTNRERRKVVHSLPTTLVRLVQIIHYSIKEWLYDTKYRIVTLQVANKYKRQEQSYDTQNGQGLYEHSYKYLAYDRWREQALPHLQTAQKIETEHVPLAQPSYSFEQGALTSDTYLLDTAISTLDPVWERNYLSEALSKRLLYSKKSEKDIIEAYSARLFQIDPARFIVDNLDLPVGISLDSSINPALAKRIIKALRQAGLKESQSSVLSVVLKREKDGVIMYLQDNHGKSTGSPHFFHNITPSQQEITSTINSFSTSVFQTILDHK